MASAVGVGETAADESADGCAEDQDADHEALCGSGQPEVCLHRLECAVDDASVVTEQQTAEGGYNGDEA